MEEMKTAFGNFNTVRAVFEDYANNLNGLAARYDMSVPEITRALAGEPALERLVISASQIRLARISWRKEPSLKTEKINCRWIQGA